MSKLRYRDLVVWQKAMETADGIYAATQDWPKEEVYGLTNQVRRAAVAVAANIAEGNGRTGSKEFLHFLSIANGSLYEVETHLLMAQRLQYLSEPACEAFLLQTAELERLLKGLISSLRRQISSD